MSRRRMILLTLAVLAATPAASLAAPDDGPRSVSVFPVMPDDSNAVVLGGEGLPVHGDGIGDDTDALQAAIDEASRRGGESWVGNIVAPARNLTMGDGGGVVYIPEGTYRITRTLDLYASVRLVGFGETRPRIVLGPDTPGFQEGTESFMIAAQRRPFGFAPITFGNNDTFATGLMNLDLVVEEGNPAAVGVRWGGAQLFLMQDVDIDVGDGYAGIDHNANLLQRVTVRGGEVGMLAFAASPGWQTSILDSRFEGQREAGIKLHTDSKLTVMRTTFTDAPLGITATPGQAQRLYVQDSVFDGISDGVIVLNDSDAIPADTEPDLVRAQNQLNVVDVGVTASGPLLRTQPSGRTWTGPGSSYLVTDSTLGLRVHDALSDDEERSGAVHVAARPAAAPSFARLLTSDIPLPPSSTDWVSIVDYAAAHGHTVGTGVNDDHAIFQQAIDEHETIFLPQGEYLISDTLRLLPETNLIGLHPRQTWLKLPDEQPAFSDPDQPRAMLETPPGGRNIVMGIGLDSAENTPGSAHVRWRSGASSHLADIITQFVKWHPEETEPGDPAFGDPGYQYRGDHRYSIWVDGGGGTFSNIFTATGWSDNGFLVESSHIESRVYQTSVEHHENAEVVLRDVRNWEFHALQTEAHIYGWRAQAVTMEDTHDVLFGNTVLFRVGTVLGPHPSAIGVRDSSNITIRGTRGYRPLNVENTRWGATVTDVETGRTVPELDVAYLAIDTPGTLGRPAGHAVSVAPSQVAAVPGGTAEISVEIRNEGPGPLHLEDVSMVVPDGWAVDLPSGGGAMRAGSSSTLTAQLHIGADAPVPSEEDLTLTVSVRRANEVSETSYPLHVGVGGINLAAGSTVSASSVLSTNAPTNAVNGRTTGARWISGSGDPMPTFAIEFDGAADLVLARVYSGVTGSDALRTRGFVVEGETADGWVELGAVEDNDSSPVDVILEAQPDPVERVRLRFTEPSASDGLARVFAIELYGMPR